MMGGGVQSRQEGEEEEEASAVVGAESQERLLPTSPLVLVGRLGTRGGGLAGVPCVGQQILSLLRQNSHPHPPLEGATCSWGSEMPPPRLSCSSQPAPPSAPLWQEPSSPPPSPR